MSDTSRQGDWTKPAAMAIPKGGFFKDKVKQGRYGPIFPKTPACYGFSIIAKIIPGREEVFYEHAKNIEKAVADSQTSLAVLKAALPPMADLSRSRGRPTSVSGHLRHRLRQVHRGCRWPLRGDRHQHGLSKISKAFRRIGRRMPAAFIKFVRDHQCPSFLEYGEYPYVSADEIKKALQAQGGLLEHARPDAVILPTVAPCLRFDDIQHILLTRAPALTGRYEFLSFRDAAGGRAWLSAILEKVQSAAESAGFGRTRTSAG